jgi:hypothetical protein
MMEGHASGLRSAPGPDEQDRHHLPYKFSLESHRIALPRVSHP